MNQSIIGKVIDNYEITGVLGKGGMGVVYKAKDMTLDRDVALKMMDGNFARDEEFLKRFKSEAKALAKLQSPNIVSVFALRETEIGFCLVMEFVEGNTLADRIRLEGAMPLGRAIPIFKQLTTALDHAHRVGVIHRDIKPSNVILTSNDLAKIADFGLAKIQQVSTATVTMGTGGTLYYMSPEQVKGLANVDARGDIYSLGMTLYETVAGRVPFGNNETDFDIRQMIVEGKIPPPEKAMPTLPRELNQVIAKAIHRDPMKRYQSCAEMADALATIPISAGQVVQQKSTTPVFQPQRAKKPSSPQKPLYLTLVAGALLIAAFFVYRTLVSSSPALLSVTVTPPDAKIFLNGKQSGNSPLKDISIEGENVRVRVERNDYLAQDTLLAVRSGEAIALAVELVKIPAQQQPGEFRTVPSGEPTEVAKNENVATPKQPIKEAMATLLMRAVPNGSVSIDGGTRTQLSNAATSLSAKAGSRIIRFEHPTYGSTQVALNLKANETKQLTCFFETQVNVGVSGESVWGTVTRNGKQTDESAPTSFTLGAGRHRIGVTRVGYETVGGEQSVVVEPTLEPKEIRLVFEMKKK